MVDCGVACLTPRKACLGTANIVLCILAAVFMCCACASFGAANTKNVPWVTASIAMTFVTPADTTGQVNGYVGLAGSLMCMQFSDKDVATSLSGVAKAKPNEWFCTGADPLDAKTIGVPELGCGGACVSKYATSFNYDLTVTPPKMNGAASCASTTNDWKDDTNSTCYKLALCYAGGAVTFGLALAGLLFSLFTLICFMWRRNGDGCCAKTLTFFFTLVTTACALASFVAYAPCTNQVKREVDAGNKDINSTVYKSFKGTLAPGAGGVMSLMGCLTFFYVMIMNVLMKVEETGDNATGLDQKV